MCPFHLQQQSLTDHKSLKKLYIPYSSKHSVSVSCPRHNGRGWMSFQWLNRWKVIGLYFRQILLFSFPHHPYPTLSLTILPIWWLIVSSSLVICLFSYVNMILSNSAMKWNLKGFIWYIHWLTKKMKNSKHQKLKNFNGL